MVDPQVLVITPILESPTLSLSERTCLSVSDPTLDLEMSVAESTGLASVLEGAGWSVAHLSREAADIGAVESAITDAGLFHFGGHGISDVSHPRQAALLYNRAVTEAAARQQDPFGDLASAANWEQIDDQTRIAVFPGAGSLHEITFQAGAERRFESAAGPVLWARYEKPRNVRGAELWTAGDIAATGGLGRCQIAVLSSCQAAQGGLSQIDEHAGLPAAFASAGVHCVVSALWPVEEDTAAIFVTLFAEGIAAGGPEPDMLDLVHAARIRQRDMSCEETADRLTSLRASCSDARARARLAAAIYRRRNGAERPFADPYQWAGFSVTGANRLSRRRS